MITSKNQIMENADVNREIYDGEVHQNIDNIVEETKETIMEEIDEAKKTNPYHVSDEEIKKAIEFLNPDASSMESRG